jgi:hypothetical protein
MSRNLKQYNNQLKYAKRICKLDKNFSFLVFLTLNKLGERRIKGFSSVLSDMNETELVKDEKKVYVEQEVSMLNDFMFSIPFFY